MKKGYHFEDRDKSVRCIDCNRPIKKKLVIQTEGRVKRCYCCNNLSKGIAKVDRHKWDYSKKSFVHTKTIDFEKLQKENRRKYGWNNKNSKKLR